MSNVLLDSNRRIPRFCCGFEWSKSRGLFTGNKGLRNEKIFKLQRLGLNTLGSVLQHYYPSIICMYFNRNKREIRQS